MNTHPYKAFMPDILWEIVFGSQQKAAPYLHGLDAVTRNIGFARELYALLEIDFHRWPRVSVAGSKGKGSTSVLLASILQARGERVGLISSPEMRRFNERIRVDGQCVSDEVLVAAAHKIAPAVRSVVSHLTSPQYLGPGGVILALGAMIFAEANISVLVVEAGRGGEYDEARLVEADVSVLTPIMLEHADKLGPTVRDIARTKTYITAPGRPIVTAPQTDEVQAAIESVATELHSSIAAVKTEMQIKNVKSDLRGVSGDILFHKHLYQDLRISLPGQHQIENAATALLAASLLLPSEAENSDESIFLATERVRWPGRAQILQQEPLVLLDGAINRESAAAIREIIENSPMKNITAIVCVPQPKDLAGLCAQIAPIVDKIIVTQVPVPNLEWYLDAASIAGRYGSTIEEIAPAEAAFKYALTRAKPDETLLLLGTQSFVGAALHFWEIDTCRVW